jgi:hypothetical protein
MAIAFCLNGCSSDPVTVQNTPSCTIEVTTTKGTDDWDWQQVEVDEELNAVASGPNGYFIAGARSLTKSSDDGLNWSTRSLGGSVDYLASVSIGQSFIAVGTGPFAKYAAPTETGNYPTGQTQILRGLACSGALAVAVGDAGELVTTPDGRNWTRGMPFTDLDMRAVTWTGTLFVAGGDEGAVFQSHNGTTWLEVDTPFRESVTGLGYHGGHVVAVTASGDIWRMGLTGWHRQRTGDGKALRAVAWGGNAFVAVGDGGTILVSPDASCWVKAPVAVNADLKAIAGGDRIVVIGDEQTVLVSDNAQNWEIRPSGPAHHLEDLTWNGLTYVAVGMRSVFRSSDGQSWVLAAEVERDRPHSVAWAGDGFVAVGSDGVVFTSPDGSSWQRRSSGHSADLWSVYWTGEKLLAGGDDGLILASADGVTWNDMSPSVTGAVFGIAASSTEIVAVTTDGYSVVSTDGEQWSSAIFVVGRLYDITWTGTQYVAVGGGGTARVSEDGKSWQRHPLGTTLAMYGVGSDGERIYAVGSFGLVFSSTDGVDWVEEASGFSSQNSRLRSVLAADAGAFIGGDNGIILERRRDQSHR